MFLSEHRRFLYLHLTDVISSADLPRPTLNLCSYKTVHYHESDAHEIFLDFIDTHAAVLDGAFAKVQMSESMRSSLQKSDWMFSGLKTFHELHEAFPSLIDEKGERKPFERFYNDVQKVDETYNRNYLRAEFNFATASAEMAARWEEFERDGDRYFLQYRTVGDDRVRGVIDPFSRYAEKSKLMRVLHGVTLPVGHPFWDSHFPPNGWNCRCDVMQVRKSSHEATSEDALSKRITALNTEQERQKTKREMFRFNPGKQKKVFPDYHPYSIKRCNDCDLAKGKFAKVEANELCAGCALLRQCIERAGCVKDKEFGERLLISKQADKSEVELNTEAARILLRHFRDMHIKVSEHILAYKKKNPEYIINGMIAERKGIESEGGIKSGFRKAIEQGCEVIVLDLNVHMKGYALHPNELAKHLAWRKADFQNKIIKECYIVHKEKAIVIKHTDFDDIDDKDIKQKLISTIEKAARS